MTQLLIQAEQVYNLEIYLKRMSWYTNKHSFIYNFEIKFQYLKCK